MSDKQIAYLHRWYIDIYHGYVVAHGNVKGHYRLMDSTFIHTSEVQSVEANEQTGEVIIITRNTEYHCDIQDCLSKQMDEEYFGNIIELAAKLQKPRKFALPDNSILLVISNYLEYYFDTVICKYEGNIYEGFVSPHTGMFQDSCLIRFSPSDIPKELYEIDLRYFPHYQNMEAYSWYHRDMPVYIENSGDEELYFNAPEGLFKIEPGVRVLIDSKNAINKKNAPNLSKGDLYPAPIMYNVDIEGNNQGDEKK